MMTNSDHKGQIFPSHLTGLMDSFSCSLLNTSFYVEKKLPEVPENAEMEHDMMRSL